jgi:hypothetical protein
MSAARPLRRRSILPAAFAPVGARPAGAGHAAGHDAASSSRPPGGTARKAKGAV